MGDVIKANYQELEQISTQIAQQMQVVQQVFQQVTRSMEPLKNGDWIGRGSTAFINEMETKILPRTRKLHEALDEANDVTKAIVRTMKDAENDASAIFNNWAP